MRDGQRCALKTLSVRALRSSTSGRSSTKGQFTGRNDGWNGAWLRDVWPDCYESEEAARAAARDFCLKHIEKLEADIVTTRERLALFASP